MIYSLRFLELYFQKVLLDFLNVALYQYKIKTFLCKKFLEEKFQIGCFSCLFVYWLSGNLSPGFPKLVPESNLHHCSNVTVVVYLPSSWLSYLWFNCSWVRLGTSELSVKSMQYFPAWSEQTFVVETFVRQKSASIWRVDWWTALPQNACLTPGQLQWRMRGVLILLPQYLFEF